MIEIVKHGKTRHLYKCPKCECKFYACESDKQRSEQYLFSTPRCPECGEDAIKECFFPKKEIAVDKIIKFYFNRLLLKEK